MNRAQQVERQRAFYDAGVHAHLRPELHDHYAHNIVTEMVRSAALQPSDRVLEIGAGFGRFTLPLLDACASVLAVDLSQRALDELRRERDARAVSAQRCEVLVCDVHDLSPEHAAQRFDAVVGFFFLHHVPDFAATIARLALLLKPGGCMAFVEPNRRNPLFVAQVMCCADMKWSEEKGMFRLARRGVERAYVAAGLLPRPTRTFGFFPPQIFNRFASARRLEGRLQSVRPLRSFLPFYVLAAQAPSAAAGCLPHHA